MKSSCSQACKSDNACGDRASPAVRALSGVTVNPNGDQESTGPLVLGNDTKKDLNGTVAVPDSRSRKIDESDMKDPALAPGASRKNREVELLNKKRKRKLIKKYIDDEAEVEEGEEDDEIEIEGENEDEYDLNDSFIDNGPIDNADIKTNRELYLNEIIADMGQIDKERKKNKKIKKEPVLGVDPLSLKREEIYNMPVPSSEKKAEELFLNRDNILLYFNIYNIEKKLINEIIINKLNIYISSFFKNKKLIEFKNNEKILSGCHDTVFWYKFLIFLTAHYKFDLTHANFEEWDNLDKSEIEEYINSTINKIIKDNLDRTFTIFYFINFYTVPNFKLEPMHAALLYKNLNLLINLENPESFNFKILINPGQTKKIYEEVNIVNYLEIEENYKKFYADKSPDYDENLNMEKLNEKKEQVKLIKLNEDYIEKAKDEIQLIGDDFQMDDNFDNDFSQLINSESYINKRIEAKIFGFVIYMEKNEYKNENEELELNKEIHIPHLLPTIMKGVLYFLKKFLGKKNLKQIIVAHEHGDKNHKCHIQGYINFKDKIRNKIPPSSFKIREKFGKTYKKYLIMFQKAWKPEKLQEYVLKMDKLVPENKAYLQNFEETCELAYENFFVKESDKLYKPEDIKKNKKEEEELYNILINQPNLDYNEIKEMVNNQDSVAIKKWLLTNLDKIKKANELLNPPKPEFKCEKNFPIWAYDYMDKYKKDEPGYNDNIKFAIYKFLYNWFICNFLHNDPKNLKPENRKRGLLLFGKRGKGKTYFFMKVCGDHWDDFESNPYIIYCRNTINASAFSKKKDTAELIILDDITYIEQQKEMIKGLMAGQPTYLRSLYTDNILFNRSCPVVMLSNNYSLLNYINTSSEFNEDVDICGISIYIGPENTQKAREYNCYLDPEIERELEEYKEKQKKKRENNINGFNKLRKYK